MEKTDQNRHKCTQYFITFSRWKEYEHLKELADIFQEHSWIYIVQEEHDDEDHNRDRNSIIHYHVSIVLKHGIPWKKMVRWITRCFPNDWKRVKIEKTKVFESALSYMKKESTVFFEFGKRPSRVSMPKITRIAATPEQLESELIHHVIYNTEDNKMLKFQKSLRQVRRNMWGISYSENEHKKLLDVLRYANGR